MVKTAEEVGQGVRNTGRRRTLPSFALEPVKGVRMVETIWKVGPRRGAEMTPPGLKGPTLVLVASRSRIGE
jgi:hypothetical protein